MLLNTHLGMGRGTAKVLGGGKEPTGDVYKKSWEGNAKGERVM